MNSVFSLKNVDMRSLNLAIKSHFLNYLGLVETCVHYFSSFSMRF